MFSTNTMKRRKFLKLTLALLLLPFSSQSLFADDELETYSLCISRDGIITDVTFMQDGQLIEEAYLALCLQLKDVRADIAVKMDIELLKVLARGQAWLKKYGFDDPLIITSAYRTHETNSSTEGAAQNSMHIYGLAVDIKYPGLTTRYLAVLFRSFGGSGIGIYPTFLHVDTWRERVWVG